LTPINRLFFVCLVAAVWDGLALRNRWLRTASNGSAERFAIMAALRFVNGCVAKSTYLRKIATIRTANGCRTIRRNSNSGKKLRQWHPARRLVLAQSLQTTLAAGIALGAATISCSPVNNQETKS